VGALVFLACLGLLIFWLILRKRSRTARELRSKALDLTEADHHHDSEKTEVRILGGGSRFGGYSGRQDSPPPVSVVGGRSWYSRESREHHGRHPSSSSGGHGQVQSYVNVRTSRTFLLLNLLRLMAWHPREVWALSHDFAAFRRPCPLHSTAPFPVKPHFETTV
jgi:hypothetical protein